jgi:hypothetical protein
VIVAAPAIVASQTGSANEPWNDPWSGPWPALLDRPVAVDPELAVLQQRIDASLEQLLISGGEAPAPRMRQIAEREP